MTKYVFTFIKIILEESRAPECETNKQYFMNAEGKEKALKLK